MIVQPGEKRLARVGKPVEIRRRSERPLGVVLKERSERDPGARRQPFLIQHSVASLLNRAA